ncbi:MAG: hypothetical protein AMJ53_10655 [Gammaproteobacteria bacterium SG8_11]|nr:MAG: hypothetical protein AMJ53_10655 [Gammaproteobacteria bacterium SG8_11]
MATIEQDKEMVTAHLKLQKEFRDYIAKHGFDYAEFSSPSPGSFYADYRKRKAEIDAVIAPELKYYSERQKK